MLLSKNSIHRCDFLAGSTLRISDIRDGLGTFFEAKPLSREGLEVRNVERLMVIPPPFLRHLVWINALLLVHTCIM